MPFFKVVNTYKYTEETVIEAKDKTEALTMALNGDCEFERNEDDSLYDSHCREILPLEQSC